MAIKILTGAPRSGKTYFAVRHIAKTYFDYAGHFYSIKPEFEGLKIVTNIDGLRLPHEKLSDWIQKAGGSPSALFAKDTQEKISQKYNQILYVIDEAQFIFPSNFRDNSVFNWFQYHGHLGQDIILLSQDLSILPKQITILAEFTIHALPRSRSLTGGRELKYNVMLGREVGDKIVLMKKKRVFDLYKSQNFKEVEKVKNPFLKYFAALVIVLALSACHFIYRYNERYGDREDVPQKNQTSEAALSPGYLSLSKAQGRSPVTSQQQPPPQAAQHGAVKPSPDTVPVKLNYIVAGNMMTICLAGYQYSQFDFPYPVRKGPFNTLIADIPLADYELLFPQGPPSRDRYRQPSPGEQGEIKEAGLPAGRAGARRPPQS